jgi:hypothetical protein
MGDIIKLADHVYGGSIQQPLGNGAREMLIDHFLVDGPRADRILIDLWLAGYKLVPLEKKDLI